MVKTLREAVDTVIKSNKKDGYPPNRFSQLVSVDNNQLPLVCTNLIKNKDYLGSLYDAFKKHPNLMTLEDYIAHFGQDWKFHEDIINEAVKRKETFNSIVGFQRYTVI